MMFDRRTVVAGLAGLAAAHTLPARAEPPSPLAHGELAENTIAKLFEPPRAPRLPRIAVWTPNGTRALSTLYGRTLLIDVWSDDCNPCLGELTDLAKLQAKFGSDKFSIVPILSGAERKLTTPTLAQLFKILHAEVFEPLIEVEWSYRLIEEVAGTGWNNWLPCKLIIAPDGTVVARQIGMPAHAKEGEGRERRLERGEGQELVTAAEAGGGHSSWATMRGEEFARAMANGFVT